MDCYRFIPALSTWVLSVSRVNPGRDYNNVICVGIPKPSTTCDDELTLISRIIIITQRDKDAITAISYIKEILTAMRVMVVSIGSRGSHIPAMTPRRLRRGVIAGM